MIVTCADGEVGHVFVFDDHSVLDGVGELTESRTADDPDLRRPAGPGSDEICRSLNVFEGQTGRQKNDRRG